MIISNEHRFIMFLPWKCGSTTCELRFNQYNESPYPSYVYFSNILKKNSCKHIIIKDFLKLPEASLNYHTISWVRNPYDRLYSGFLQRYSRVVTSGAQADAPDAEYVRLGWDEWLKNFVPSYVNQENDYGGMCRPLHEYTHLSGEQYVDFIGHIESFDLDTKKICDRFQLTVDFNMIGNVKNRPINANPLKMKASDYKYIDKYNSSQIQTVNEVFARDFELFGYNTL